MKNKSQKRTKNAKANKDDYMHKAHLIYPRRALLHFMYSIILFTTSQKKGLTLFYVISRIFATDLSNKF